MADPAPAPPDHHVEIREAINQFERQAAGAVTAESYAEFAPDFDPDDWAFYARTLPETTPRVEQGTLLVAVDAGAVVATVTLYLDAQPTSGHWREGDAVIRFLAVRPDRRRQGIGKALLNECIRRAARAGRRRLALQTTQSMGVATDMYVREGFVHDPEGDLIAGTFRLRGYALDLSGRSGGAE